MSKSEPRTAVLLGAGASADAGLPLTRELASKVVAAANAQNNPVYGTPDWVRALNAVYAGMVAYQGEQGKNPLAAVNIETLISAIRLLRDRENHEVAPFVASWAPSLTSFGSSDLPNSAGKTILDAVGGSLVRGAFGDSDITKAVAEIARSAVRPDLRKPFEEAEQFVLRTLVDLLEDHGDVAYFEPLLDLARSQVGGLDVITLNYDLTVEAAAQLGDVPIQRGVDGWQPGDSMAFERTDGTLNLMKLHGSLDWRPSRMEWNANEWLTARSIDVVPPGQSREGETGAGLPWIVVGDREKLATDGPTLALNFAAREALRAAAHLVVVGYAFGDFHINSLIRDWLQGDSRRTVTILDYSWPRERYPQNPTDFRSALVANYARARPRSSRTAQTRRVLPLEGPAATHLESALHTRPAALPATLVSASRSVDGADIRIDVTWHGDDLMGVQLSARASTPGASSPADHVRLYERPARENIAGLMGAVAADAWRSGETKAVFCSPETAFPLTLTIGGAALSGGTGATGQVP